MQRSCNDKPRLFQLMDLAIEKNISYLYINKDSPCFSRNPAEDLVVFEPSTITGDDLHEFIEKYVPASHRSILDRYGYTRFVLQMDQGVRCRLDLATASEGPFILVHILTQTPYGPESIGLDADFGYLASEGGGLYIVSSKPRSGKSLTLASVVSEIASKEAKHIVWISRATEYVFAHRTSLITQFEVHVGETLGAQVGTLSSLSPDVIVVDMPLDETFLDQILSNAENGSKVFLSTPSSGAVNGLCKLVEHVCTERQEDFRARLAQVFERSLYVELIKTDRGVFPAVEILTGIEPVKNLLKEGKYVQIADLIPSGAKYGMQTLAKSKSNMIAKSSPKN